MHLALALLFGVALVALLSLNIAILARQQSLSQTDSIAGRSAAISRAALLEAENAATAHVFEELSLFAGNLTALDAAQPTPAHPGPLRVARALAIVHIAMADAIGAATRAFEPYTGLAFVDAPTSECAAALAAAHDTLVVLYPALRVQIGAFVRAHSDRIATSDAKRRGTELGREAARLILALRADDGAAHAEPPAADFESSAPGKWRRDPIARQPVAMGGLWAELVAPFVIDAADQFRLPPPPRIDSNEFALEFAELVARGGLANNTVRDEWGTMVGLYWAYDGTGNVCAPPRLYLQLVLAAAQQNSMSMLDLVRATTTAAVAMADTGLAAWDSKYYHRRARPVTFIRDDADADHNSATARRADWQPLGAPASNSLAPNFTPPFPAYPSGHAAFGSAAMQVLRTYMQRDRFAVQFTSSEFDGVTRDNQGAVRKRITRTFDSATQMELENADSRIQLGIHWRRDCTAGMAQGAEVAQFVLNRLYTPALLRSA